MDLKIKKNVKKIIKKNYDSKKTFYIARFKYVHNSKLTGPWFQEHCCTYTKAKKSCMQNYFESFNNKHNIYCEIVEEVVKYKDGYNIEMSESDIEYDNRS